MSDHPRLCLAATLAAVLLSAGCAQEVFDGTPAVETQRLDCDLIFPGPESLPGDFVDGR